MHNYCVTVTIIVTITTGGKKYHKARLDKIILLQDSTFLEQGKCSLRFLGHKQKEIRGTESTDPR
jgi:hypothetical protein